MGERDDVVARIYQNEVSRNINKFTDDVVARIDQNEVSRNIKKFIDSNFQIWKFQTTIVFRLKEQIGIAEGFEMIENDDEIRGFGSSMTIKPWHSSFEVVAIDKKAMVSLINYRISATMW